MIFQYSIAITVLLNHSNNPHNRQTVDWCRVGSLEVGGSAVIMAMSEVHKIHVHVSLHDFSLRCQSACTHGACVCNCACSAVMRPRFGCMFCPDNTAPSPCPLTQLLAGVISDNISSQHPAPSWQLQERCHLPPCSTQFHQSQHNMCGAQC